MRNSDDATANEGAVDARDPLGLGDVLAAGFGQTVPV